MSDLLVIGELMFDHRPEGKVRVRSCLSAVVLDGCVW